MKKLLLTLILSLALCSPSFAADVIMMPLGGPNFGGMVTDLIPGADDTYDIGEGVTPLEWKDLWIDGTAYIDTLDAPVNVLMGATDANAIVVDGTTDDYTGAGTGVTALFQRDINRGTGAIPDYAGWQSYATLKHTNAVIEGDRFAYGAITRIQSDGAGITIEDGTDRQYWEVGTHSTVKNEGTFDTDGAGKFTTRFIGYYSYVWADTYTVLDTGTGTPANVFSASGMDIKVEHVPIGAGAASSTFNSYGLYIEEVSGDTAGTSSAYGIYIADAVSGADTNYAIYSADTDDSYLAGGLTIAAASSITTGNLTLGNGNLIPSTAGSGVAFVATAIAGRVTNLTLSGGGTGYTSGDLIFTGGDGSGAAGTFVAAAGIITSVTLTNTGSGYTTAPTVDGDVGGNADAVILVHLAARTSGLLDNYEEGTFMPGVTFGANSIGVTYNSNTAGYYSRIGNTVVAGGFLQLTSKGTSNGDALITGLPYLLINANGARTAATLGGIGGISFADQIGGYGNKNGSYIILEETTVAGVKTTITDGNFANDSQVKFSITYHAQ
jgi:hypothetical protein